MRRLVLFLSALLVAHCGGGLLTVEVEDGGDGGAPPIGGNCTKFDASTDAACPTKDVDAG